MSVSQDKCTHVRILHTTSLILSFGLQEMTAAFKSEFRQQEHEFNLKMDEMRAVVLSHNLKVRRVW